MISIKHILCPTDLSPHSGNAMRYALALSRVYQAKLIFLYCEAGSSISNTQHTLTIAQAEALESLLFEHIDPANLVDLHWQCLVHVGTDDIGEEITKQAQETNADFIVMRSRRRPRRAALLGSTAESVCRSAPCPVLVMHDEERESITADLQVDLKRVLVAYDFSEYSELAFKYGLSLAQQHQADLHLLHVLPPHSVNEPEIAWYPNKGESAYHLAATRLQRAIPAEAHLWCNVKTVVREGHPYREILNYAEENEIDLISVGAHGAGFGMRALFGSNVDRVLRQAPCPVLVARHLRPACADRTQISLRAKRESEMDCAGETYATGGKNTHGISRRIPC
jgi:nucleotide-binding universal stress UspA family protein